MCECAGTTNSRRCGSRPDVALEGRKTENPTETTTMTRRHRCLQIFMAHWLSRCLLYTLRGIRYDSVIGVEPACLAAIGFQVSPSSELYSSTWTEINQRILANEPGICVLLFFFGQFSMPYSPPSSNDEGNVNSIG